MSRESVGYDFGRIDGWKLEDDSKLWAMKQHDEPYLGVEFHFVIDLQSHNYGANIPTYDGCVLQWLYKVYVPSNETN